MPVTLDTALHWREVAALAEGETLALSATAADRVAASRRIVEAIVERGMRVYGVNTGVGALSERVIAPEQRRTLSRNIIRSHAVGVGPLLPAPLVRAIMVGSINNLSQGFSGVRPALIEAMLALLNNHCTPDVPGQGSVGYLSHMAHVSLVLMGDGSATLDGTSMPGGKALATIDREPLVLDIKEGLSLVNGTPCATGLAGLALARAERLLDWADAIAALTFESLGGQVSAFGEEALAFHRSPGVRTAGARLRDFLEGSERLTAATDRRVQDALSLRAIPHVHGAARDLFAYACGVVERELASVSDNPIVAGTPDAPKAYSTAHAVGAGLALAMDGLGTALAEIAAMAERRLDRLVNPLVSGLPAFLAPENGVCSGFMIAHYTAVSLNGENRRLAAPASLDGGVTSGLQEDHLSHATPAALKALAIIDNATQILGIELVAAAQAAELAGAAESQAPRMAALVRHVRETIAPYADDRALAPDLASAAALIRGAPFAAR